MIQPDTMALPPDIIVRPARREDTAETAGVFLATINELYARRGVPLLEGERGERSPLHLHWLAHDAERFWVAERGGRVVGFSAGLVRPARHGSWWFLGALFVAPEVQGRGVGRALLERAQAARPDNGFSQGDRISATIADALQPISVTLYARQGLLPRLPLLVFGGRPRGRPSGGHHGASGRRSSGAALAPQAVPADGTARTRSLLREVDLAVTGIDRTVDHEFLQDGRRELWLLSAEDRVAGYIYVSPSGAIGPGAVSRPADMAAVARHALARAAELGAETVSAIVPAVNEPAQKVFWDAGLVADAAMGVLLASRRFGRFDRYLVGSFGLM